MSGSYTGRNPFWIDYMKALSTGHALKGTCDEYGIVLYTITPPQITRGQVLRGHTCMRQIEIQMGQVTELSDVLLLGLLSIDTKTR